MIDELAVVAPIDAVGELGESNSEERVHVHAGIAHAAEKTRPCGEASHMVVDHHYFHSLTGFLYKYVGYFVSEFVVGEYVVL